MKKSFLAIIAFFLILVGASYGLIRFPDSIHNALAAVFFTDSITADALHSKYDHVASGGPLVNILIVPGHDNVSFGTQYRGTKEADMNADLGTDLFAQLSQDPHFHVVLARNRSGFLPPFDSYFSDNRQAILDFAQQSHATMNALEASSSIDVETGVYHHVAPTEAQVELFGINKWASENHFDIVLHIHFNDYPGRKLDQPGKYSGFAIYIPDHQYSNAKASRAVATSIFGSLSTQYAPSSMPQENTGLTEDQDLIAIGSGNTLDPAGMLIEYGYIYELKFNPALRALSLENMALLTAQGIQDFFSAAH